MGRDIEDIEVTTSELLNHLIDMTGSHTEAEFLLDNAISAYEQVKNNPVSNIDPAGHAGYLVSWTNVGGSRKNLGGTHLSGIVISLDRNKNNLHNAVSFSGNFAGVSLGLPAGGSYTRSQLFKDSYGNADVRRIQGYSSFTSITSSLFGKGGISWGMYAFGDLYSVSDAFSNIEGFEIGFASMQGKINLEGEVFEVTPEFLNLLMELEDPLAND